MGPEVCVGFLLPRHEVGRLAVILDQPATPEVVDAFLVAGRANYTESMEVNGTLNDIGGFCGLLGDNEGIAFKEDVLEEVRLVFFELDAAVSPSAATTKRQRKKERHTSSSPELRTRPLAPCVNPHPTALSSPAA